MKEEEEEEEKEEKEEEKSQIVGESIYSPIPGPPVKEMTFAS